MGGSDRSRSPQRDEKVSGVAQRWNQKGFGFIKPDDGGEDLFCHYSSILDGKMLVEGAKVQFVKRYDERKGKDRAEEVTGGSAEEDSYGGGSGGRGGVSGPPPEGKQQGTAKRWNAEKGFGFIKPDDGGDDLFCHFSCIEDGNALSEGSVVHYVKQYDDAKGKERAEKVVGGIQQDRGGGGGYGGGGYGGGGGGYGGGGGGRW
jgi:cold shock CspA family protein